MMATKLPILQLIEQNDFGIFIDFWKKLYFYPLENLYNETIVKTQFDLDDIQQIFIWKNKIELDPETAKYINTCLVKEYMYEYQGNRA